MTAFSDKIQNERHRTSDARGDPSFKRVLRRIGVMHRGSRLAIRYALENGTIMPMPM
jgi:hypothetical protein